MGKMASSRFLGCFLSDPFHTCRYYNDGMHESLDEFEIWPDSTTDYGVSCP